MSPTYSFNLDWYLACLQFAVGLRIDFIMVLNVPEILPKVTGIVTLSGGGGGVQERPPCHSLKMSLWGRGGQGEKGKSDDVTLYDVFSFWMCPLVWFAALFWKPVNVEFGYHFAVVDPWNPTLKCGQNLVCNYKDSFYIEFLWWVVGELGVVSRLFFVSNLN